MKKSSGLHLCDAKDPDTGRYCTCSYISEDQLLKHMRDGTKHKFLRGQSSKDIALRLSAIPGGATAVGSRPDRQSGSTVETWMASPDGTPGSELAICYKRYHRRDRAKPYIKPEKLKSELDRLFKIQPPISVPNKRGRSYGR